MSIKLLNIHQNILNMNTRLPFKYGIATLTALPHLILKAEISVNGNLSKGLSSDGLAPKWFTKNPETSFRHDIEEMLLVIQQAVDIAMEINEAPDLFSFWFELYKKQSHWGKENKLPPLLTSLGSSLVERALISAFCHAHNKPFHELLNNNQCGYNAVKIIPDLKTLSLNFNPAVSIQVRHTVGLADPILNEDIPQNEVLDDGLPQSLEENIKRYSLKKFKIKISGNLNSDTERLLKIESLLLSLSPHALCTVDGNEFFKSITSFKDYWNELRSFSKLNSFWDRLLFIEQPLHRDFALSEKTMEELKAWIDRPKIIIDESDGDLNSAASALEMGYAGTSHKNCKGIFKSLANKLLIKQSGGILSAEDLCNVGPIALQQDLAVAALLGISHVERNGHHYMPGLKMFPTEIQNKVMENHSDLYSNNLGYPSLKINNGKINLSSVNKAPFGVNFMIDSQNFTPVKDWEYTSLSI